MTGPTCALAETAMARCKAIIGPGPKPRSFDRQQVEAALAVRCINRVTALGMPVSVEITRNRGRRGQTDIRTFHATTPV